MREYPFGQKVKLSASFENDSGVAADPSTITFQYGLTAVNPPPSPTATSAVFGVDGAVVKASTGRFSYSFLPAESGNYTARVAGTGNVAAAQVVQFRVKPYPFA